ncbi:hypothetical protein V8V91_14775 [Algoriphagus halophilus]|uniref:hypothetical protein n=1 Tax=Algoriphagus halophilus TaxID=226505 RepID=UPI00358E9F3B
MHPSRSTENCTGVGKVYRRISYPAAFVQHPSGFIGQGTGKEETLSMSDILMTSASTPNQREARKVGNEIYLSKRQA